jgi:hypothetical protein
MVLGNHMPVKQILPSHQNEKKTTEKWRRQEAQLAFH